MIKDATFSGEVIHGTTTDSYCLRINGSKLHLCQGDLYEQVGGPCVSMSSKLLLDYGWGYEGSDPDILSITLLALALGLEWGGEESYGNLPLLGHYEWFGFPRENSRGYKGYYEFKMPSYCYNVLGLIRNLFKDFTSEVIANFGDTWELTTDEILQWVNSKEKQCS